MLSYVYLTLPYLTFYVVSAHCTFKKKKKKESKSISSSPYDPTSLGWLTGRCLSDTEGSGPGLEEMVFKEAGAVRINGDADLGAWRYLVISSRARARRFLWSLPFIPLGLVFLYSARGVLRFLVTVLYGTSLDKVYFYLHLRLVIPRTLMSMSMLMSIFPSRISALWQ